MRAAAGRRRRCAPAVLLVAVSLLLAACGGGGAEDAGGDPTQGDDPLDELVTSGERSVQVTGANRDRLGGTLFVPRAAAASPAAKVPGVLFVPSIGPGERNGPVVPGSTSLDPLAADLATSLADAGVASYRYDRRGTGESTLEPGTPLAFDDLVADARAGIDLLSERKETAGSDLAVVAYDTGGLVALRLAATDPRVKRLVLISTPGRPLVDVHASVLSAQFGPESGEALRAAVEQLLTTQTLPPTNELRTELRPLLPPDQIPFLVELYSIDPLTDATRVSAPGLIVVPSDPQAIEAMAPSRLEGVMPAAEVVPVDRVNSTLQISGTPAGEDRSDPNSPVHDHGASPPRADVVRDQAAMSRIVGWLGGKPPA